MDNQLSDAAFVERLAAAQMKLRAYAISLVWRPSDADDILQNVSLALWEKRENYDASRDFFAWACGVVLVEVKRYRQRSATERLVFGDELIETLATEYVEKSNELDSQMEALRSCVDKLDKKDRELLRDRYRSNYKPKELSDRMGCPVQTLYSALARVRHLLQRCVVSTLAKETHPQA